MLYIALYLSHYITTNYDETDQRTKVKKMLYIGPGYIGQYPSACILHSLPTNLAIFLYSSWFCFVLFCFCSFGFFYVSFLVCIDD